MRSRYVGLVTGDPALYADLAAALRDRHLPTLSLWPGERIPDRVAVVLTTQEESARIEHPRVLSVPPEGDRTPLWAAVVAALDPAATRPTGEIVVGLDPGPRPGYAVFSGSRLLVEGVLASPEASAELARGLPHRFPSHGFRFRVGSGDPPARNRIVRALGAERCRVELVDEHGTNPPVARRDRDAAAARAIARTPGEPVGRLPPLSATRGAIRDIQRLSREGSGGRFTISRALAGRVLLGELSLPEALGQSADARRNEPPGPPMGRPASGPRA